MAVYRQIQTTFWQDAFVLSLTPEEKYFYIYLMTNSKTKQCGIYELPLQIAQIETGYNRETVIKLIQKFIEFGKIAFDWETSEIALKNWMKYNPDNNPKIAKCVEKELSLVKNETLINFIRYPIQGVSQKEKEKEEEEEKKEEQRTHGTETNFESIWSKYPNRQGKKDALRHFKASVKTEDDFKNINTALDNYLKSHRVKTGYIKNGSTWFNDWQSWVNPTEQMMGGNNAGTFNGHRQSDQTSRATYSKSPEQVEQDVRNTTESIRLLYEQRGKRA